MTPSPTYGRRFVMTILKKRLAVLALGLAVTALASPSYARGAGRHIGASDPTTLLAPPTPQARGQPRPPAPPPPPRRAPTTNGASTHPPFRAPTEMGQCPRPFPVTRPAPPPPPHPPLCIQLGFA